MVRNARGPDVHWCDREPDGRRPLQPNDGPLPAEGVGAVGGGHGDGASDARRHEMELLVPSG